MSNATPRLPGTETAPPGLRGLDTWSDPDILTTLFDGQARALAALRPAIPALATAARTASDCLSRDGRLIYLAAGSPALIALGDALELPQTYGLDPARVLLICPGGLNITRALTGAPEDDTEAARVDVARIAPSSADCVIAISASGSTPYTLEGLVAAQEAGAEGIAIACNPGSPLLAAAALPILLDTGSEVIAGSTRMGAGTAQKVALNMLSTLIGVHLGHVHDGLMVNLRADNAKLRARATRMVAQIAGVTQAQAAHALEESDGEVKLAVLMAVGVADPAVARQMLDQTEGNLREALAAAGLHTRIENHPGGK
jgi:N-acetylmuramic acid 6-phosphate etherase